MILKLDWSLSRLQCFFDSQDWSFLFSFIDWSQNYQTREPRELAYTKRHRLLQTNTQKYSSSSFVSLSSPLFPLPSFKVPISHFMPLISLLIFLRCDISM